MARKNKKEPDTEQLAKLQIDPTVTIDSIVGQDEAVQKIKDLALFMKEQRFFRKWDVRCPKAFAFTGPPGCGKTEAIRALSNESSFPVISLSVEDITGSLYGEAMIKLGEFKTNVEALAETSKHVIILIDEAESFFTNRSGQNVHPIDKQIIAFFLKWIDGLFEMANITFIAISNLWSEIDPALRRAGRFEEIKFKPLGQDHLWELYLSCVAKKEAKLEFQVFEEFQQIAFPSSFAGSDISFMVSELVKDKAKFELSRKDDSDMVLISKKDVEDFLSKFKNKKDPVKRSIGFGY